MVIFHTLKNIDRPHTCNFTMIQTKTRQYVTIDLKTNMVNQDQYANALVLSTIFLALVFFSYFLHQMEIFIDQSMITHAKNNSLVTSS